MDTRVSQAATTVVLIGFTCPAITVVTALPHASSSLKCTTENWHFDVPDVRLPSRSPALFFRFVVVIFVGYSVSERTPGGELPGAQEGRAIARLV